MSKNTVELGDRVREKISGFEGICTQIVTYLNGCDRILIQPETLHEGKPIEGHYFDVLQVSVVKKHVMQADNRTNKTGGATDKIPARQTPKR